MFSSKMCMVMLYLVLTTSGAVSADQFLSMLYGLERQNYMLICLKGPEGQHERACAGALLSEEWVGVSAGCLRQHPQENMVALRQTGGERCEDVAHGYSSLRARGVRDHFYHPWFDLVLVILDRPYMTLDVHPNSTAWTVRRAFRKHGQWRWMKEYMKTFALTRDIVHHYKCVAGGMVSLHSPLFVAFFAIVMPTLIFILVFIYVIFYSSSPKVPFKSLQYNKKTKA